MAESLRMTYERSLWKVGIGAAAGVILLGLVSLHRQQRSRLKLRLLNAQLERDLLARTVAETALRNSETRFRALLDSAPQTVLAIDSGGAIAFANAKVEQMFGYPREDLLGASPDMLIADLLGNSTGRPFSSAAASQTGVPPFVSAKFPGRRKNGTEFPIEVTFGRVEANENLTLAFITDVSERAALEEQLRQSQKLESIGQLAGGVAHDFNNLLTVISGYAQMALGELPARSALRDSLEQISRAADRAADLTRQLLLFSRRRMVAPKLIKVNELIQQTEKMLRRLIGENIELILALDARGETVRADPGHIEQVIVNLSVNARDAMPEGGRLVIATGNMHLDEQSTNNRVGLAPGRHLVLRISDTGHGMAPEVKARIFEPFFTTKGLGKGTGLGLSTVYGIIKQTGGAIFVTSEPGNGSVFEILLPVTEAASGQEVPRSPVTKPAAGSETILVAEDENTVRTLIKNVLEAHGYKVLVAAHGNEALEIASEYQGPIHLLLTDVIMPEMGGVDLAARFSQLHPDAAIAQMSGYADNELRVGSAGAFIEKPFTPAALLHKVQEILRIGKAAS